MKTNSTKIKLFLTLCLMLTLPLSLLAFAAPDPSIYVCSDGAVKLKYTGGYTLVNTDQVIWQEVTFTGSTFAAKPGVAPVIKTYSGAGTADLDVNADVALSTGAHYWVAHVISASGAGCTGDVSEPINVYKLPPFTVTVSPTTASFCIDGSTNLTKPQVTATVDLSGETLPTNVVFNYNWAGSTATAGAVNTDQTKFDVTATAPADYNVIVKVTFDVSATTKVLKSPVAGPCSSSATAVIKATSKPAAPVITVE
jgi:hypothetical protein